MAVDFDRGAGSSGGKILVFVIGADTVDDALAACEADSRAPLELNCCTRGKGIVSEHGRNTNDFVTGARQ